MHSLYYIIKLCIVKLPIDEPKTIMETIKKKKYIYWQDEDMFIGYLEEYPDYWTQGTSLEELQNNLLDLYHEFTSDNIPAIRKVAELELL